MIFFQMDFKKSKNFFSKTCIISKIFLRSNWIQNWALELTKPKKNFRYSMSKAKKKELKFTSPWYRQMDRVRIGSETIESLINQIAEVPDLMLFHFLIQFDLNFQNLSKFLFLHFQKSMRFSIYKRCLERQEVRKHVKSSKKHVFGGKVMQFIQFSSKVFDFFKKVCPKHGEFAD